MVEEQTKKDNKKETAVSFIKELFNTLNSLIDNYSTYLAYLSYVSSKYNFNDPELEIEPNEKQKTIDLVYAIRVYLTKINIIFFSMKNKFHLDDLAEKEIIILYKDIKDSGELKSEDVEKYITLINGHIFNSVIGSILEDKQDLFIDTQND